MVFSNFIRCGDHVGFSFYKEQAFLFCPEGFELPPLCKLVYTSHVPICIKLYQPRDGVIMGPYISMIEEKLISAS